MWSEPTTRPGVGIANVVQAYGEVEGPLSVPASPSVPASSIAPEPEPAPLPTLPAYVVSGGVRHVPIDELP